jgi:16S rRNA (cytidine1402-2'-O)-methyltransferase
MSGELYLIPTALGGTEPTLLLPTATQSVLPQLRHFIVENAKSARAFLKSVHYPHLLQETVFMTLDEHTPDAALAGLLAPLKKGIPCGLLSEAGCPGIADPGAALVRRAHAAGIRVVPLVGPSSILLALMGSGLNGQRFAFHGYLPVDRTQRAKRLIQLEAASQRDDATQILIEAPYRNQSLLQTIFDACRADTWLCIAVDITLASEMIFTQSIGNWRKNPPPLQRRPAVFLLYRNTN